MKIPLEVSSLVWVALALPASSAELQANPKGDVQAREPTIRILWSSDLDKTQRDSKKSGKPVAVVFHAIWCPVCRKMKRETFSSSKIQSLGSKFLWVSVDIDRQISLARSHDVQVSPEIQIYNSAGNMRARYLGFFGPAKLREHLLTILDKLETKPERKRTSLVYDLKGEEFTRLSYTPRGFRGDSICFSHVGYGPLHLTSQSPFQSLRLGLMPRTPSTLTRGQVDVRWNQTWSNVWAKNPDFSLDYETLESTFSVLYGITDTMEVEIQVSDRSRFGGVMDPLPLNFHDLFGIDQNGRDQVPRGQFTIDIGATASDPAVSLTPGDRGSFSQTVALSIQHNVTCGTENFPAFSYALTARYNLEADDIQGGDDVDVGVSVSVSRRFGDCYGYISLGHAWFGNETFRGLDIRSNQVSGLGAIEWRYRPRRSVIIQYLVSEGVAENRSPFSLPSHEITLGWKGELRSKVVLEFGVIENLINFDNSPDVGFHGGVSYRF